MCGSSSASSADATGKRLGRAVQQPASCTANPAVQATAAPRPGTLPSAGTMPIINLAVGLEVAAGFTLLLSEFLDQTLVLDTARRRT